MLLSLAFDSEASLASRAALWLSVSRMMLRKNRVFGFGALVVELYNQLETMAGGRRGRRTV